MEESYDKAEEQSRYRFSRNKSQNIINDGYNRSNQIS